MHVELKEYYWSSFNTNGNYVTEIVPNLNYNVCGNVCNNVPNIDLNELLDELTTESEMPEEDDNKRTLVVNLFGGPGSGKSTTAAGVFYELKSAGINCELAAEYAKDLTWEERHQTFKDQIYIFGKQYHRICRLLGQVDVIITDSPILLTPIYDSEKRPTLKKLVIEEHMKMWTFNAFINRVKKFNPKGRLHNENEACHLDMHILDMLNESKIPFSTFEGNPQGKNKLVDRILWILTNYKC